MSRTIEAIMPRMTPAKRRSTPAHAKRLTANWQSGFETGGHVQRKLRLAFTMAAHQQV
jgi:hypothetical protein